MSDIEQQAPPVGEEIHLPGPSLLPLLCAVGITLAVIGTTINWLISIVGADDLHPDHHPVGPGHAARHLAAA